MEIALILILIVFFALMFLIRIGKKHKKTDWGHKGLNILDGINRWFCLKFHRLPAEIIKLPESGPAVLVSNHISGLDPLLLIAATTRPLRFMIAQEEFDRWWLKWLLIRVGCIPVKRDKNPKRAMNLSIAALESGEILVVFPQGKIVVEDNDKPLKKGAFTLAQMVNVPTFSFRIEGVGAKGFTILSIFIRSKAKIIQYESVIQIDDQNIKPSIKKINDFFFGRSS